MIKNSSLAVLNFAGRAIRTVCAHSLLLKFLNHFINKARAILRKNQWTI